MGSAYPVSGCLYEGSSICLTQEGPSNTTEPLSDGCTVQGRQ